MMAGVGCEPIPALAYLAACSFHTAAAAVGARVTLGTFIPVGLVRAVGTVTEAEGQSQEDAILQVDNGAVLRLRLRKTNGWRRRPLSR